ncbi:MAG: lipoprotein-releasing system permease protein [Planctomycetota bacterium]
MALSMAVMIISTSLINGFQQTISNKVFGFWSHIIIQPYGMLEDMSGKSISTDNAIYLTPEEFTGIKHIQKTALKGGIIHAKEDFDGIVLKGVGKDFDWTAFETYLKDGSIFEATEKKNNKSILISQTTADRLQLAVDDKLIISFFDEKSQVRKRSFKVSGIFSSGIQEFDKQYALIDIGVIQYLNNWEPDEVGGFEVFVDNDQLFNSKLKTYFIKLFGGFLPEDVLQDWGRDPLQKIGDEIYFEIDSDLKSETIRENRPELFNWLELQTINEIVILGIMLLVAAFNMITALLILILERTNMIGILKALGAGSKQLKGVFLINGSFIILTGILLGNFFGIGICILQDLTHFIKLPEESYYISYAPIKIDWLWVLILNIFTLLTSVLFLILPAILVSKIKPIKAIRFS